MGGVWLTPKNKPPPHMCYHVKFGCSASNCVCIYQPRSQDCQNEEADRSSVHFPLPSVRLPSPPLPSPSPFEVGPLNPAVSSPSGVWGGTTAEIEFGAF